MRMPWTRRSIRMGGSWGPSSLYSPNLLEQEFCELRLYGVLRSSARIILTAHPCSSLRPTAHPAIAGTISLVEPRRSDPRRKGSDELPNQLAIERQEEHGRTGCRAQGRPGVVRAVAHRRRRGRRRDGNPRDLHFDGRPAEQRPATQGYR